METALPSVQQIPSLHWMVFKLVTFKETSGLGEDGQVDEMGI